MISKGEEQYGSILAFPQPSFKYLKKFQTSNLPIGRQASNLPVGRQAPNFKQL
ncbi:hypothetical protein HNP69_001636 [Chryseobacterium koreense]|nr:hypothetical protein [Chryseobacterium koreense]